MDTEKQRQCRRDDASLTGTESGNARSEQLNTRGAYRVANQQSLACLSGSERRRPSWFLDMKYQTCSRSLHRARSMGWALFRVNFRPLQEIKAKLWGWADIWYWALFRETTVKDTSVTRDTLHCPTPLFLWCSYCDMNMTAILHCQLMEKL